jgi:hypothetical protein
MFHVSFSRYNAVARPVLQQQDLTEDGQQFEDSATTTSSLDNSYRQEEATGSQEPTETEQNNNDNNVNDDYATASPGKNHQYKTRDPDDYFDTWDADAEFSGPDDLEDGGLRQGGGSGMNSGTADSSLYTKGREVYQQDNDDSVNDLSYPANAEYEKNQDAGNTIQDDDDSPYIDGLY